MSKYTELKAKHQAEVNAFPFGFAFSQSQFDEMMKKWGLKPTDIREILSIGGGGYIRRVDADAMHEMFARHEAEHKAAMQDDEYLYEMFDYELANHEYGYTHDVDDTLDALGLTAKEVNDNPKMKFAFQWAIYHQSGGDPDVIEDALRVAKERHEYEMDIARKTAEFKRAIAAQED